MAKTMLLDNSQAKPKAGKLWTKKLHKWKGLDERTKRMKTNFFAQMYE